MLRKIILLTFLISSFGLSSVSAQETSAKPVSGGVLNGKASKLPMPAYPPAARAVKAGGAVNVQVLIDENGEVVSANAVSGHPLLRQAAEAAARQATFAPTRLSGQPVKVSGIIVYNFVLDGPSWTFAGFSLGTAETEGIRSKINLPVEFADEQRQLEAISGLSADEQKAYIANTVSLIKSKLNAADLWRFEFGLAKGKIMSGSGDENAILVNLAKFKELANSKPDGVQEYEIKRAAELAKFADKGNLTEEDKQAIFSYLR